MLAVVLLQSEEDVIAIVAFETIPRNGSEVLVANQHIIGSRHDMKALGIRKAAEFVSFGDADLERFEGSRTPGEIRTPYLATRCSESSRGRMSCAKDTRDRPPARRRLETRSDERGPITQVRTRATKAAE